MPLGSSSAAPVIRPGPSRAHSDCLLTEAVLRLLTAARFISENTEPIAMASRGYRRAVRQTAHACVLAKGRGHALRTRLRLSDRRHATQRSTLASRQYCFHIVHD